MSNNEVSSDNNQHSRIIKSNSYRQKILNDCFRESSADAFVAAGILDASASSLRNDQSYRVLEIGCGYGWGTYDLARSLGRDVTVVGIDINETMIEEARALQDLPENKGYNVEYRVQSSEEAAKDEKKFDAVWIRFVLMHVPDPVRLLTEAATCLKSSGVLLVEDINAESCIHDPPLYALEWLTKCHNEVSLRSGGDVRRGPRIGGYMDQTGLLEDIQFNVFSPIYAKGMRVHPWCVTKQSIDERNGPDTHYKLGLEVIEMSVEALAPKFLEMNICTEEEVDKAKASMEQLKKRNLQLFSIPGNQVFQWWAKVK